MENLVYVLAPLAGLFLVSVASYKWFSSGLFGLGGLAFCMIGLVLIGLPVWQSVAIDIAGAHVELIKSKQALNSCAQQAEKVASTSSNPNLRDRAITVANQAKGAADSAEAYIQRSQTLRKVFREF